ncbi:hypothetical protein MMC28_009050 [Mycoblastus sanguinarius]|nr:hypothetical protein [Mycoblastus sanguinarius]
MASKSFKIENCNGKLCASCRQHAKTSVSHATSIVLHSTFQYAEYSKTGCIKISQTYKARVLSVGISKLFTPQSSIATSIYKVQTGALRRWDKWMSLRNLRFMMSIRYFRLESIFQIFDDYLFRRALRSHVRFAWVGGDPFELGYYGRSGIDSDLKYPTKVLIEIVAPAADKNWDESTVQNLLATCLHELAHAVFELFECKCVRCQCHDHRRVGSGFTGHGPQWKKLAEAIEVELRRSFSGFEREWVIPGWRDGDDSDRSEKRKARKLEMRDRKYWDGIRPDKERKVRAQGRGSRVMVI